MNFFGIGLPEMAVIAAIGLLVFGPKRLPELGKTLGKTLRGFQSASQEFEKEFRQAVGPEPESSGSEAAAVSAASSFLPASSEIAELPAPASTSDPAAQPQSLSPDPSTGPAPAPTVGDAAGS